MTLLGGTVQFSSVAQSCPTLQPHELQHAKPPCPSPISGVYPNPCPSSRWCHPTISSSVIPFSSHLQSFPGSGSFQMSQLFASGGQSTRVSASTSVLPMNTQDWSLGCTGWISLQSKPAWLHLNLITSARTLFPNKVTSEVMGGHLGETSFNSLHFFERVKNWIVKL